MASVVSISGYTKLSDHPLINRFIKGVFNLNPPKPRYTYMWDVNIIFTYLKKMGNESLSWKYLTEKLAVLLVLLSGQRCSTLLSFDVNCIDLQEDKCILYPHKLFKHSRAGRKMDTFIFNKCG